MRSIDTASATLALAALGHASRMEIYRYLLQAGAAGRLAGSIGKDLAMPPSTLSFHLRELRQAGLIAAAQNGRTRRYSVQLPAMLSVLGFLSRICCADQVPLPPEDA